MCSKTMSFLTCSLFLLSWLPTSSNAQSKLTAFDFGKNGSDKTKITVETRSKTQKIVASNRHMDGYILWAETGVGRKLRFRVPTQEFTTDRAEHRTLLARADTLDPETFRFIEFESTAIESLPDRFSTYKVTGLLRVRGVERSIVAEGTILEVKTIAPNREKGFIGEMIHLRFVLDLRPSLFGIPWPTHLGETTRDVVLVEVNVFGFTNERPDRAEVILQAEHFPPPESRPATRPSAPESRPEKKP